MVPISRVYTPPPPPLKLPSAQEIWEEGGGGYIMHPIVWTLKPWESFEVIFREKSLQRLKLPYFKSKLPWKWPIYPCFTGTFFEANFK